MCCKYFLLTFTVYKHRERFNLNLMQWAVSKFLEETFCLWVGKDIYYHPAGNKNLKMCIPQALYFSGLSLHAFSLYLCFSILFKVLLHVMYNFVLNVFNVFVHTYMYGHVLTITCIMLMESTCQKLRVPLCRCDLLKNTLENQDKRVIIHMNSEVSSEVE